MGHAQVDVPMNREGGGHRHCPRLQAHAGARMSARDSMPAALVPRQPDPLDAHLDAILRAAGSGLRHYSMAKTKDEMRAALRAAINAHGGKA
jgi:hypothetical protein